MGDNLIVVQDKNDVAKIIADKILEIQGASPVVIEQKTEVKTEVEDNTGIIL